MVAPVNASSLPAGKQAYGGIDLFRMAAAFLVIAIHTSPLDDFGGDANFILTRIIARTAVPFFFMASGFFLLPRIAAGKSGTLSRFLCKSGILYLLSILLYAPLSVYTGQMSLSGLFGQLFFDGTFYHLWYLPASMLGMLLLFPLIRKKRWRAALFGAALLYLIGLFGDSYYGIGAALPVVKSGYDLLFSLFAYTRNGLFFAPLFLLLGGLLAIRPRRWPLPACLTGFILCFSAMLAEGLFLHRLGVQRHDSMYVALVPLMLFLFDLLLHGCGRARPQLRQMALLIYLIHPACILFVRLAAKLSGQSWMSERSLPYFFLTALTSFLLALLLSALWRRFSGKGGKKTARKRRVWADLDMEALRHNVRELRALMPAGNALMAVLKADAYGHGAPILARELARQGVHAYAVATLEEGICLRRSGIPGIILILGYTPPGYAPALHRYRLTQTVFDLPYAAALAREGKYLAVHIKIDTGMHRLGIPAEKPEDVGQIYQLPYLQVTGIFSHLCVADSTQAAASAYTREQARRFFTLIEQVKKQGYDPGRIHLQSSYGTVALSEISCDYARVGLFLYGLYGSLADRLQQPAPVKQQAKAHPDPRRRLPILHPVLSLYAQIVTVRDVPAGEGVGYGLDYVPAKAARLAIVSAGYADGIPRALGGRGRVLVRGDYAPIVGRICMDQLIIDVTGIAAVAPGDTVTLIGRDGAHTLYAEEMAANAGTIPNEIVSRLGSRPPRYYQHRTSPFASLRHRLALSAIRDKIPLPSHAPCRHQRTVYR